MPMIRTIHNKENPYIQLNKAALWDKDLSLEAVGLWARLLSRPDDWQVSVLELCKSCGCGKQKIYRLLSELVKAGYAYRCQPKVDSKKCKNKKLFSAWQTYVFEFKIDANELKKCFPQTAFPLPELPLPEKADTTNKDKPLSNDKGLETKKEATNKPPNPRGGDEPGGSGLRENMAFGKFVSLAKDDYYLLCSGSGKEVIDGIIDEINDFLSSTGKKPYKDYAATIRNWLRRRQQQQASRSKPQTTQVKEMSDLTDVQNKNWKLNHDLVNELKIDCPDKCGGFNFYYKHYVLKDKNNPNFDISALIDHRSFCQYLDKHYKLNTEDVIFHGKI